MKTQLAHDVQRNMKLARALESRGIGWEPACRIANRLLRRKKLEAEDLDALGALAVADDAMLGDLKEMLKSLGIDDAAMRQIIDMVTSALPANQANDDAGAAAYDEIASTAKKTVAARGPQVNRPGALTFVDARGQNPIYRTVAELRDDATWQRTGGKFAAAHRPIQLGATVKAASGGVVQAAKPKAASVDASTIAEIRSTPGANPLHQAMTFYQNRGWPLEDAWRLAREARHALGGAR